MLRAAHSWRLKKKSDWLSVEYQKKKRGVWEWLQGFLVLNKWKDSMPLRDIKKILGEDFGDESKEFSLEHIKCKLCIKHPRGSVKLSWIWVWWFGRCLCYRHEFGHPWCMHNTEAIRWISFPSPVSFQRWAWTANWILRHCYIHGLGGKSLWRKLRRIRESCFSSASWRKCFKNRMLSSWILVRFNILQGKI